MKLLIEIPKFKICLYDHDYNIICKFFQENLAEAPITVQPRSSNYDIKNNNIWQILSIKL